jgi:hypothetical protein
VLSIPLTGSSCRYKPVLLTLCYTKKLILTSSCDFNNTYIISNNVEESLCGMCCGGISKYRISLSYDPIVCRNHDSYLLFGHMIY